MPGPGLAYLKSGEGPVSMCICGMTAGKEQALEALQCSVRGRLAVLYDSTAGTKDQGRGFGRGEWQQAPVGIIIGACGDGDSRENGP